MIQREIYLKQLIRAKDNGLPKVVTGIRRCGKSTLLKDIYSSWLKENGGPEDHILFLSLDKDENAECLDPLVLGQRVRSWCRGKDRCYVFLDEIQLVRAIHNPIFHEGKHLLAKPSDEDAITFVSTVLGLSDEKKHRSIYNRQQFENVVFEHRDRISRKIDEYIDGATFFW